MGLPSLETSTVESTSSFQLRDGLIRVLWIYGVSMVGATHRWTTRIVVLQVLVLAVKDEAHPGRYLRQFQSFPRPQPDGPSSVLLNEMIGLLEGISI